MQNIANMDNFCFGIYQFNKFCEVIKAFIKEIFYAACPKPYFVKNDKGFDGSKNRCFLICRAGFCSPLFCIVLTIQAKMLSKLLGICLVKKNLVCVDVRLSSVVQSTIRKGRRITEKPRQHPTTEKTKVIVSQR